MTTEPTDEQKQAAQEVMRLWTVDLFNRLRGGEAMHLPRGAMTALTNRVAEVLSSRDTETRNVLEGLHNGINDCWCPTEHQEDKHTDACLATQALWNKLQPQTSPISPKR